MRYKAPVTSLVIIALSLALGCAYRVQSFQEGILIPLHPDWTVPVERKPNFDHSRVYVIKEDQVPRFPIVTVGVSEPLSVRQPCLFMVLERDGYTCIVDSDGLCYAAGHFWSIGEQDRLRVEYFGTSRWGTNVGNPMGATTTCYALLEVSRNGGDGALQVAKCSLRHYLKSDDVVRDDLEPSMYTYSEAQAEVSSAVIGKLQKSVSVRNAVMGQVIGRVNP